MILFPAIDLKDGQCVRLLRGDMTEATVYGDDPAAQARTFAEAGAQWLHIVDLNGAFEGRPVNHAAVEQIIKTVKIPIQLGGGIRDMATAEHWLALGVRRIILGTAAVKKPDFVRDACRSFPGRVAIGIDARGGKVAVEGWAETSDMKAVNLARKFVDLGVAAIIYTDIDRDGALQGPNLEETMAFAREVPVPVILSGGVSSMDDLRAIAQSVQIEKAHIKGKNGIVGVITGRALYDGRVDLKEALLEVAGQK